MCVCACVCVCAIVRVYYGTSPHQFDRDILPQHSIKSI